MRRIRLLSTTTGRRRIDMRSDTVVVPSAAMRDIMHKAEMGDDVYGEDPSCLALERYGAELMDKESCVFVSSGTQGNLASFMAHCDHRSSEIIVGDKQHTYVYEQGGSATLAGIHSRVIPNEANGTLAIPAILRSIQHNDQHYARTRLVSVENTHNMCGGIALPMDYLSTLYETMQKHNVKVHMDGARVCNASVALGVDLKTICSYVDTISLCLSKGLGAPVGSLVAGDEEFIRKVRRAKKALGGGWRKAGGLASAGIYALERREETLTRDHALAKTFAQELCKLDGVHLPAMPQTNMVFFQLKHPIIDLDTFAARCKYKGLWLGGGYGRDGDLVRTVMHQNITEEDASNAVRIIQQVLN